MRYEIDPNSSRFTVQAFATGMLSVMGHNPIIVVRDFDGHVEFDPESVEKGALKLRVKTDGMSVSDDIKPSDRQEIETTMREKVLEVDKYPEIVFESNRVSGVQLAPTWFRIDLAGKLELHGVTRGLTLNANLRLKENSLNAEGEFKVNQTDFGIKLVSVAGGTLKLKDELKAKFNITARQEPS